FFFSSRRRHTRFKCDWSSDVCSSDLALVDARLPFADDAVDGEALARPNDEAVSDCDVGESDLDRNAIAQYASGVRLETQQLLEQIGRASCREREESSGVAAPRKIRVR